VERVVPNALGPTAPGPNPEDHAQRIPPERTTTDRSAPPPRTAISPSREVTLGGYWVTRIGAILVLLAAIFLAAYLSIYSTPTIRLSELIAASCAALGIAYWQQARGNLRFALVLHSLGDALVFFSAFAAYAFEPTKVIGTVTTAIVLQSLAGAAVCAHALHRRSEGSAVFALVLLTWVAGFSLDYQHSGTTLGYVAAIALIGAILRLRWEWNWPLAYSTICGPILAMVLASDFSLLRPALEITFGLLPVIAALPFVLSRESLDAADRTICFLASGTNLAAALLLRYELVPGSAEFDHQLLVEAGSFWLIGGLFATRRDVPSAIRAGLKYQAVFLGAVSAALYLAAQFPDEHWTALAILGVGIGAASSLRHQKRWVSGYAYLAFCVLSQIWLLYLNVSSVRFGSDLYWDVLGGIALSAVLLQIALGEAPPTGAFIATSLIALCTLGSFAGILADPGSTIPTLLTTALLAVLLSRRFEELRSWALAALIVAHLEVIGTRPSATQHWLLALALLTAADAIVLFVTRPFRQTKVQALPLIVALYMLGTLFYGFSRADLDWSVTFIWVPLAGATFLLGFWQSNPSFRIAALIAFAPCVIRLFAEDLNSAFTRIVAFFLLGIILLGVGYLYTRLSRFHRAEGT